MEKIKLRSEIDNADKWDLSSMYKNNEEIINDMEKLNNLLNDFSKYENHIMDNKDSLYNAITLYFDIIYIIEKLSVYSKMKFHEDMDLNESKNLLGQVDLILTNADLKLAFFFPELLKYDYSKLLDYIKNNPKLETYKYTFECIFREKDYTLSLKEEQILARLGEVLGTSDEVFSMVDDVDITFDNVINEKQKEVELNSSNYGILLESKNREVRKDAFNKYYAGYSKLKNTYAATLKGNIKATSFISKTRGYDSPLQMSLYGNNIDIKLYDKLISLVNDYLPQMHKYIALRKEVLKLDEFHMYDLIVPLTDGSYKKYTYNEAKELVLEALKPLGEKYISDLEKLLDSKIVDIYNNKNKRSGAYSWGSYDSLPYVLLNFDGTFGDVSTLAHELGHAMHSFYSTKNNPFHDASYTIFLAEIASTVNEILLNKYCYEKANTKEEKLYFINNLLEMFRATLFRQTMFAEFEKIIYEKEANGESLTEEFFSNIYLDLVKKYHGSDVIYDQGIELEWARISHFYRSFYVYKYATGISVSASIASDLLNNNLETKENYLEFLKSGGKDYPLEILKKVNIDITNDDTIKKALELFKNSLEEYKVIKDDLT